MAVWLLDNMVWLIGGVIALIVAIKVAVVHLFRRLAAADAAAAEQDPERD